jgi:hypothetical protein
MGMAIFYLFWYLLWMLFWGITLGILSRRKAFGQPQIWRSALGFWGLHLALLVPATLIVLRSEIFYDLSAGLSRWLLTACNTVDMRVTNRAAAMLLSTGSWLYQWVGIGLWLLGRPVLVSKHPSAGVPKATLLGAGLSTLLGGLFALGVLWHGFRCPLSAS